MPRRNLDAAVVNVEALGTGDPDPGMDGRASRPRLEQRWRVIAALPSKPSVDIVIPVHDDERDLALSARRLHAYLRHEFPFSARITIADGASTDGTLKIASQLASDFSNVRLLRINEIGRGRALAAAWLTSDASVVAQIEVGLASGLSGLLPLVAPILSGYSDVSIAGRTPSPERDRKRRAIDRIFGLLLSRLLRLTLGIPVRGQQRRIRALRSDVARRILPTVGNRDWFFDTELLVRAEQAGLRIHELRAT
jgi:glycosyltransferase involved in cell wall biosynthesis